MPSREISTKGRKNDTTSKQSYKYANADEIRRSLRLKEQNEGGLIDALTALRNQLTVKYGDLSIPANDERLLLIKSWLDLSPGAQDIFSIWEGANSRQMSLLAVIVATLSSILTLLSSQYTYHAYAQPIMRTLLTAQWAHRLNSYLAGTHTELLLVTLKLFNSMSEFAGGRERKSVLEVFAWETKSLPKLLHMRRKTKGDDTIEILARPDIRTLYILFVLSFVQSSTPSIVKATFLEQRRDAFTAIFKGLSQDSYSVVRKVLEVCWTGIWSDPKLKRTLKIAIFNEATLSQLLRLYDRTSSEGDDPESVPVDVVHHFLLALCSHPGVGLCFKDRGWYPREIEPDQRVVPDGDDPFTENPRSRGGRIYNKALANVVKGLKVNEDPRQQELALKILAACPELIAGYWSAAALALEPRLSSKWIANIAFFGSVISMPVPMESFYLPEGSSVSLYQPVPPPLSTIIDNILPSMNIKIHLSRGLQSPSPLVQHCTALALVKSLLKYEAVMRAFDQVEKALEEDEDGQWSKRRREIVREVRKRVPDFQVIVGFSQKLNELAHSTLGGAAAPNVPVQAANPGRTALLLESAHRLLWLYHLLLPSVVAEARFDAGKLLQGLDDISSPTDVARTTAGLDALRQLHVLRLLKDSEQFTWSGKTASKHSNLHILLKAYVDTDVPPIRAAITSLLCQVLPNGVLFQHDASEILLWLDSLPTTRRASGTQAPDGTILTDESDSVIAFLDDCAQRCIKTPYRYLEELQVLWSLPSDDGLGQVHTMVERPDTYPSPLLVTVLEQLSAKLKGKLVSPSDALAIVTFVRKLVFRLAGKATSLDLLNGPVEKLDVVVQPENLYPSNPIVTSAIRREVALLALDLHHLRSPSGAVVESISPAVQEFLIQIEQLPTPSSAVARQISAYELIDWVRLVDPQLHSSEWNRLLAVVERLHKSALRELFGYLRPGRSNLWLSIDIPSRFADFRDQLDFEIMFLYCTYELLADPPCQQALVDSLFQASVQPVHVTRAIRLVLHRLSSSLQETASRDLLLLLAAIVKRSQAMIADRTSELKQFCFRSGVIKSLCSRPLTSILRQGLDEFLQASLVYTEDDDRQLVADYAALWFNILEAQHDIDRDQEATAFIWIKYMSSADILALMDSFMERAERGAESSVLSRVEELLVTIASQGWSSGAVKLPLCRLYRLRSLLPQSLTLESLLASATYGSLPLCHDGHSLPIGAAGKSIASIIPQSVRRWSLRSRANEKNIDIAPFLLAENWTDSTVDVITGLQYRHSSARAAVAQWIQSDSSTTCTTHRLARIISGFCDSAAEGTTIDQVVCDNVMSHFARIARMVTEDHHAKDASILAVDCVSSMIEHSSSTRPTYLAALRQEWASTPSSTLTPYMLTVCRRLHRSCGPDCTQIVDDLVDRGLMWAVRQFSGSSPGTDEVRECLVDLSALVKNSSKVKTHLAEPVIAAAIQSCLSDIDAVLFVDTLVSATALKPVSVNKHLQSIVQHRRLYELCTRGGVHGASPRDSIVALLHTLFRLHPSNTCQPSHVEPLRQLYRGSLSLSDRRLLSIFELFETTRKTSIAALCSRWSSSSDLVSNNTLEAVQSLDPARVLKTCLSYPNWRHLHEDMPKDAELDETMYDPVFVLLLFAQMLVDSLPSSALAWVQLFRTNVVSLLVRVLSAKDSHLREVAWAQVAALCKCLEDADIQEKLQLMHIFNLLRDLVPETPSDDSPRLPAYTTLLLAHSLRSICYPSNFIYPLTARFLLQRPELDAGDVPMLYGMLYSASDDWKKERLWIVRFLSDGMIGNDEWQVLKRRHTWDLLASLFQCEGKDKGLRRGILEVLATVTCNARATTTLILRHALLSWIEMQVKRATAEESIAWIRILENVLAVANPSKLEASTNGEWRSVLGRCLYRLLDHGACNKNTFVVAVPVILRLSLLPGSPVARLTALVTLCLHWLKELEGDVVVPASGQAPRSLTCSPKPPPLHYSQGLFDISERMAVEVWGECVESLWRVCMTAEQKCAEWDELTCRLLIWRSIAGRERCEVGEWARHEVLSSMRFSE